MRGSRLPDVFVARGHAPLPRGLRRPRVTWTLIALGCVVSLAGSAAILSAWYALSVVLVLAGTGPDLQWFEALSGSAGTAFTAAVAFRAVRGLVLLWMREEDEAAASSGPDGRYGTDG